MDKNFDFSIINIVIIILAIIGLVMLIHNLWKNWHIGKVESWPKTPAEVMFSVAIPANAAAGSRWVEPHNINIANTSAKYIPWIAYRYNVNGIEYQSSKVFYQGPGELSGADTKLFMANMVQGNTISVYFDPKNPKESYIFTGKKNYTNTWIGLILLAIAIYLIYREKSNIVKFTGDTWKEITGTEPPAFSTYNYY